MATFYVDSVSGSDANTGLSFAQRWQTITKLNLQAIAGGDEVRLIEDSVFTDAGILFTAQNVSPTTAAYIRGWKRDDSGLCDTPSKYPIIDLGNVAATIGIALDNCGYFIIERIHVRKCGSYGIVVAATLNGNSAGVTIRNNTVEEIVGPAIADGIAVLSTVTTDISGGATGFRIHGNTVSNCFVDGISLNGPLGFEVDHNVIFDVNEVAAGSGDGITSHSTGGGHNIHDNTIYDCSDGIHVATNSTTPSKIYRNWVHDCLQCGINIQVNGSQNLGIWEVRNNVVSVPDLASTVGGIVFGELNANGNSATLTVYNNTVEVLRTGKPAFFFRSFNDIIAAGSLVFTNNIATGVAGAIMIQYDNPAAAGGGFTSWTAGTNFYHLNAASSFVWDGAATVFSTWQTNSAGDADSVAGTDPLLRGSLATNPRFARLKRASTAQNIGTSLAGTFTDDFVGGTRRSWNVGAMRYVAASTRAFNAGAMEMEFTQ